jgi:hypothetical protein
MPILMLLAVGPLASSMPAGPTADEVRGGWIADVNGQRHIYILNVRGTDIRGIYCWDCGSTQNLAFVESGKLDADGFSMVILHDVGPGAPYRDNVKGKIVDGRLVLSTQRQGSTTRPTEMTMLREPRRPRDGRVLPGVIAPLAQPEPAPAAGPGNTFAGFMGRGYVAPGEPEPLTVDKITGLWLSGTGTGKQYFIFRQVGKDIRGAVCGPCDNPFTFGALDYGVVAGDTFKFNIVHEDWGGGIENGPFNNQATATVSRNEMRIMTRQDNRPPTGPTLDMTLLGPLR